MLSVKEINLLEAQNEGLKKQNKELQSENFELKESLKCFQKPEVVKVLTDWRTGELDNLKAENERLKQEIKEVKKYQYEQEYLEKEIEEIQKALKTLAEGLNKRQILLQEIKTIAEFHITDADSEDVQNDMKQILNLIIKTESEVE